MAPELFKYKPYFFLKDIYSYFSRYSYKSDVWALGCVLYEITCFRTAFDA